ncbi:MAG: hypothetical protein JWO63_414, partial [Frankiales bacterium]|nr:hypothetical protein [Frankiales bacterium]
MVAPIDAEAIPTPQLAAGWLETAAWWLRSDAGRVRLAGVDIRADRQGLASVYRAPEAGQLLAVMDPVRTQAGTVADNVEAAAAALERFAQEAAPLAAKLQDLQFQAQDFRRRLRSVEHWDHHAELVQENNGYLWAVDQVVAAYEAAERECANAIESLIGGAAFHAGGNPQTDSRAYGVESIPDESTTPWGAPATTRKSCVSASVAAVAVLNPVGDWDAKLDVMKGEFSAVAGMAEGLVALTPAFGLNQFERTWTGIATLEGFDGPFRQVRAEWAMAKSTVDWDEWATDPARASGKTGVNVVSLA